MIPWPYEHPSMDRIGRFAARGQDRFITETSSYSVGLPVPHSSSSCFTHRPADTSQHAFDATHTHPDVVGISDMPSDATGGGRKTLALADGQAAVIDYFRATLAQQLATMSSESGPPPAPGRETTRPRATRAQSAPPSVSSANPGLGPVLQEETAPGLPAAKSASTQNTPSDLLEFMLAAWQQVKDDAARWLGSTDEGAGSLMQQDSPSCDAYSSSAQKESPRPVWQAVNIRVVDGDSACQASFPFLEIIDHAVRCILARPSGDTSFDSSYLDAQQVFYEAAGQVPPPARRRISSRVMGDVDYDDESGELIYTIPSDAVSWDAMLNFLSAIEHDHRAALLRETPSISSRTHSPTLNASTMRRREFCCPISRHELDLKSVPLIPERTGRALSNCVLSGLREECRKNNRYDLRPWNIGDGPWDWDMDSPCNRVEVDSSLDRFEEWILAPMVPGNATTIDDALTSVMVCWWPLWVKSSPPPISQN
ncbi:hypothetical protein AURDEDRAFT_147717, partial [Auricularia subglabra TFB-10046 SS5]